MIININMHHRVYQLMYINNTIGYSLNEWHIFYLYILSLYLLSGIFVIDIIYLSKCTVIKYWNTKHRNRNIISIKRLTQLTQLSGMSSMIEMTSVILNAGCTRIILSSEGEKRMIEGVSITSVEMLDSSFFVQIEGEWRICLVNGHGLPGGAAGQ